MKWDSILTISMISALVGVLVLTDWAEPKCDDIKKVQAINDSLLTEIDELKFKLDDAYSYELELNRHQVAFKIFATRNPKAAEEYASIISDETE